MRPPSCRPAARDRGPIRRLPARAAPRALLGKVTPVTDCVRDRAVPVLQAKLDDGGLSTNRPVWQDLAHVAGRRRRARPVRRQRLVAAAARMTSERTVGVGTKLPSGDTLLGARRCRSPARARSRCRPALTPPLRADQECRTQAPPNLKAETGPAPPDQSPTAAEEGAVGGGRRAVAAPGIEEGRAMMKRQLERYGRWLIVIGVLVVCAVISAVYIMHQQHVVTPLASRYVVKAEFQNSTGLEPGLGQAVNVAGVRVGHDRRRARRAGGRSSACRSTPASCRASTATRRRRCCPTRRWTTCRSSSSPGTPRPASCPRARRSRSRGPRRRSTSTSSSRRSTPTRARTSRSCSAPATAARAAAGATCASCWRPLRPTAEQLREVAQALAGRRRDLRAAVHDARAGDQGDGRQGRRARPGRRPLGDHDRRRRRPGARARPVRRQAARHAEGRAARRRRPRVRRQGRHDARRADAGRQEAAAGAEGGAPAGQAGHAARARPGAPARARHAPAGPPAGSGDACAGRR